MADDPQDVHNRPEDPARFPPAPPPSVAPAAEGGPDGSGGRSGAAPEDDRAASATSGIELARQALAQAKADARKRGTLPGQGRRRAPSARPVRIPGRGGDPKAFGSAIRELMADRGWEQRAAVGGVFGNWPGIVGQELAEHTRPQRFDDGELTVAADSAAWATQLRLLAATLVRRLNEELGEGTVRRVKVVGPTSPRRGGWRVR